MITEDAARAAAAQGIHPSVIAFAQARSVSLPEDGTCLACGGELTADQWKQGVERCDECRGRFDGAADAQRDAADPDALYDAWRDEL